MSRWTDAGWSLKFKWGTPRCSPAPQELIKIKIVVRRNLFLLFFFIPPSNKRESPTASLPRNQKAHTDLRSADDESHVFSMMQLPPPGSSGSPFAASGSVVKGGREFEIGVRHTYLVTFGRDERQL